MNLSAAVTSFLKSNVRKYTWTIVKDIQTMENAFVLVAFFIEDKIRRIPLTINVKFSIRQQDALLVYQFENTKFQYSTASQSRPDMFQFLLEREYKRKEKAEELEYELIN